MQETLYQTADAGDTPLDSGCRRLSIRQQMQETLYDCGCRTLSIRKQMQTTLLDSGFRRLSIRQHIEGDSIRQRMQESLLQTADAGVSLSDSECRRLSIRQPMQETLHQTADAKTLSDSGCTRLYQTADAEVSL